MKQVKKYVPNLQKMQGVCSRNYALLMRILPIEYENQTQWTIPINEQLTFVLSINNISKFTEEMSLTQTSGKLPNFLAAELSFRIYHDAQMVEVITYQKQSRIRQSYSYPNPQLHQKDEKMQINLLLKEWLNMAVEVQNKQIKPELITNN